MAKATPIKPTMTDAAIKERTGKDWAYWFAALDKAGAAKLDHTGIAAILNDKLGVGPWWGQMIAVSYERARGLRAMNQKCDGEFAVSVSKTLPVELGALYRAFADAKARAKWMPKGKLEPTSATANKYWRAKWNGGARLEVGFYAKGAGKSQVAIQVNKLPGASSVEKERAAWKKAVERLTETLV
jgi:hypothetical protein